MLENVDEEIQKYTQDCLNCKLKPCRQKGCPLSNDIPEFIKAVKEGNIKMAYNILTKTTMLGAVCGEICPHNKQCKGSCVRGIKGRSVEIGKIESYVFNVAIENGYYKEIEKTKELIGKKVAVIGSGPAGLTCAAFLAKAGAQVDIYEKKEKLGGILRYGIPEFRLKKDILDKTINQILSLGINVYTNKELGKNLNIEQLKKEYSAIFIGIGANVPAKMNIEGEELEGVFGGNILLETENHPDYINKKVAVIGGGNVAMDCARTIKKLGAKKVTVIYRRGEEQMPAEIKEIESAKKENIEFLFQSNLVKIIGKQNVEKIECIKTQLIKKEGEIRQVPVDIPGSNYTLDMDYVVMAVGSMPQKRILEDAGLNLNKYGYVQIDEKFKTSDSKIYAGGDLIGQKATVAWASYFGREAAKSIIEELGEKK